ncbi:branched-chain amino acid ABC transporter substrate-binding protein [Vandammella animalimorsus]|uniref:Branched-chain amino acid ABC transporter substrate-binding protein n=1 Tax=Vandammella animalimorsus TaxID=2029117 RepID=A0A2A2AQE6_9BURK|nr:ABC transporter substrate-binding protein [Vandammella animalimorsus]PAT39951.1 branched-chain amino acid ABC transporter substrate-binding protein [Vandammella animalimorsus]
MRIAQLFKRIVLAVGLAATAMASAQDIKLGYNGDLSASPSAQSGQAAVLGMEAAIADLNAAGGVLGRKLVLVTRDDASAPPKSIQNMSELIDREKVAAVFGPTNSGNAMAWKHIANQKKIPVIGNVASGTDITKPMSVNAENYMFRISMVDREQVAALMAYVKKNAQQSKRIGLMAETTGYGQGGLKDLEEIAKLQGIAVAATERFGVGDTDMTSQLNKMKSAGVDTVVVWAQGTPIAQLVRSMEKIDYFPLALTSWAADNITFYDAAGKTLAEKPLFMRTVADAYTPAQQALFERISAKLKAPGSFSFALHGYDSVMLYAAAVRQAGSVDGKAVRQALEDLQAPVQGLLKTYEKPFSATNHEALKAQDFVWIRWKDGKLAPYSDSVIEALSSADFKK